MTSLIDCPVDLIYREERHGQGTPQRIDLPTKHFSQFQAEFRSCMAELGIEAIYPGAILGIPVVESSESQAQLTAADGTKSLLPLSRLEA